MFASSVTLPQLKQYFLHAGSYHYLFVADDGLEPDHPEYYVALYQYRPSVSEPRLIQSSQAIRSLLLSCKRHRIHKCNPNGPCSASLQHKDDAAGNRFADTAQPAPNPDGCQAEPPVGHTPPCEDCGVCPDIRTGECACGLPYQETDHAYTF